MNCSIQADLLESKVCQQWSFETIMSVISQQDIYRVLDEHKAWEQRERKLNMAFMIQLVIALAFYPTYAIEAVVREVTAGLRHQCGHGLDLPSKGALAQRRKQLGVEPMQALFARCARPIAQPETSAAFRFGLRLVALDGTLDNVPDTPANATAFSHSGGAASPSPFPQVRGVYLVECGTHVIFDAHFTDCQVGEETSAPLLLERSLKAEMLLLCDRGFFSAALFWQVRRLHAQVICRLQKGYLGERVKVLDDGSYLTWLYADQKHHTGERMLVRVIEYTFTDPAFAGAGETQRLVTTLLDPQGYPALQIVETYHERWTVETVIDEYKTHQRLSARTLRSKTPSGIYQELYGLVLMHLAIRTLMYHSAREQHLEPVRLSFTHAIQVLQRSVWRLALTPTAQRACLWRDLLLELREVRVPTPPLRFNSRVVKRVRSKYERKKPLHLHPPHLDRPFLDYVLLI